MASFSKMSVFPVGYFQAYASWLLRNRKDIAVRIPVISADITRIGFIETLYQSQTDGQGNTQVSENRVGFSVTEGSILARLCQAYIAVGGNPYDIAPFMYPDTTTVLSLTADNQPIVSNRYPKGGIVAPKSAAYNNPSDDPNDTGFGPWQGGYLETDRYYPARQGRRTTRGAFDFISVVKSMHQIRVWANQEIKEKLQDMEWRIIKQADLREQLVFERDELLQQAFGGACDGLTDAVFDTDRFVRGLQVQRLIADMYTLMFSTTESGEQSYAANDSVPFLRFVFADTLSENRVPLGC
jgi:hypothetical protein